MLLRRNNNNKNIIVDLGQIKLSYILKILTADSYIHELRGYYFIKDLYPVPNLILSFKFLNRFGIIVFDRVRGVGDNQGHLSDLIRDNNHKVFLKNLFTGYNVNFKKTLTLTTKHNDNVFYDDRVKSRLKVYNIKYVKEIESKKYYFNNQLVVVPLGQIISMLKNYFNRKHRMWSVISQGDPTELNIATTDNLNVIFFDYYTSGINSIISELTTFYWHILLQGDYISLLYNAPAYCMHTAAYEQPNYPTITYSENIPVLGHRPTKRRVSIVSKYIDDVFAPTLRLTQNYPHWHLDFKMYFITRMLTVFDVTKFRERDQLTVFAYIYHLLNANITNTSDLSTYVKKLSESNN